MSTSFSPVARRADKPDAPAYALQAAVRANQTIGRQDEARRLMREGARRFPNDPSWAELEKSASATPASTTPVAPAPSTPSSPR